MTKLMSDQAIRELRELLEKEIDSKTITAMTDEEISYLGFFFLEVFKQGLNRRNRL
jgi:hypothetical protein